MEEIARDGERPEHSQLEAWYMDSTDEDQRLEHRYII